MLPDRVSNPGPLTYESGALPIALRGPASYTVNSRALTGEKSCINKGFLVLLMHRKLTFNMIVPGPLKLFRHTLLNCHNTINW